MFSVLRYYTIQEFAIVQMTPEDDFMVLACDGLFDVYSNKEVVKAVKQEMAAHGDAQKCCEVCVNASVHVFKTAW
jgi:serine/threonine protein phosphatase PrpC